jgi:hypothetical protein
MASLCIGLFLGLNCLQHVARLGDVREIDFRRNALRGTGGRGAPTAAGAGAPLKLRTDLLGLIAFQGTGVGLAICQPEFRQYVKNLPTLDFHLTREIVDTNLTHPPLFKICYP